MKNGNVYGAKAADTKWTIGKPADKTDNSAIKVKLGSKFEADLNRSEVEVILGSLDVSKMIMQEMAFVPSSNSPTEKLLTLSYITSALVKMQRLADEIDGKIKKEEV